MLRSKNPRALKRHQLEEEARKKHFTLESLNNLQYGDLNNKALDDFDPSSIVGVDEEIEEQPEEFKDVEIERVN